MGGRLWTGNPFRYVTSQLQAKLAFHPYGVDKSSTNLPGWGEGGTVTSVGWQITLCDPIDKWRPVVLSAPLPIPLPLSIFLWFHLKHLCPMSPVHQVIHYTGR